MESHNAEIMDEDCKIVNINQEVIYQQDKAQIDVQIATAKQYPRNIKRATENALAIATMDEETAQSCNFSLPRGGKNISGASIHLAKILAQSWGNIRAGSRVVSIDDKHVTSQAICYDLENNVSITMEVKRSIQQNEWKGGVKTGKMVKMNDDMITVTGNAANSIALRNAILAVIPKSVINRVYNAAMEVVTGDISDENKLIKRRTTIFNSFKNDYGVSEAELLKTLGRQSVMLVNRDDLILLIGYAQSLKDNVSTVDVLFRGATITEDFAKEAKAKADEGKLIKINELLPQVIDNLGEDDKNDISGIIKEKDTVSYDKVIKLLESKLPKAK